MCYVLVNFIYFTDTTKMNGKLNQGQDPRIQLLKEEAKKKRKSLKKSLSTSSSVKLPPVLQLEKSVVQKVTPIQPVRQIIFSKCLYI